MSGLSGSGKTLTAMMTLRRLYNMVGQSQTGNLKHLSAAMTVLDALGTAGTEQNRNSSRIVSI